MRRPLRMPIPGKPGFQRTRALQLVSACCLRVQAFGAKTQLCKGCQGTATISQHVFFFFFFFFFSNYQAQTQFTGCNHTSGTHLEYQEIFPRAAILFLCSRDSWLALFWTRVMLSRALDSARAYQARIVQKLQ